MFERTVLLGARCNETKAASDPATSVIKSQIPCTLQIKTNKQTLCSWLLCSGLTADARVDQRHSYSMEDSSF